MIGQFADHEADFEKFIRLTGFDPRRDLREAVFASISGKEKDGLFVARGAFDISKIIAAAKSEGGNSLVYQGFNVVTTSEADPHWVAFLDPSLAVGGSMESVQAAIARRTTGTVNSTYRDLGARYHVWMYTAEPAALGRAMPGGQRSNSNPAATFRSITVAQGGLKLGNTIDVDALATTRSDKDAQALHDVMRFLAGMIQLKSDDASAAEVASLLESMQLSASGNKVTLKLSIPENQIEQLFNRSRSRRAAI
jgi:hypothetical protein